MSDRDNIVQISPTITTIIKNKTPKIRVLQTLQTSTHQHILISI